MVRAFTDDLLKNDAGGLHRQHAAGALVEATLDTTLDDGRPSAEPRHLALEAHPPIQELVVEGGEDLLFGLHAD